MQKIINTFFGAVLVTNLERRPDRLESVSEELEKFNIEASRLPAVDGHALFPELPKLKAGWKGSTWTHLNGLLYAKQNNLKNILILEDDVRFSEEYFHLLESMFSELPADWDMFYVGANDKHPETVLLPYSEHLRKANFLLTTHAYSVNARCFDFLIEHLSSNLESAMVIDVLYTRVQPQLNCFMATPNLAWQEEGYSDVLGMNVNYDFMKPE